MSENVVMDHRPVIMTRDPVWNAIYRYGDWMDFATLRNALIDEMLVTGNYALEVAENLVVATHMSQQWADRMYWLLAWDRIRVWQCGTCVHSPRVLGPHGAVLPLTSQLVPCKTLHALPVLFQIMPVVWGLHYQPNGQLMRRVLEWKVVEW